MLKPYELAIGLRYVRSRNRNRFISFVSVSSITGIAVGVAVLIVVLSVMNGFEYEVRNRILRVVAHAAITGFDGRLDNWSVLDALAQADERVLATAPFVGGQAMLVGDPAIRGVEVRGVEPGTEAQTSAVAELVRVGSFDALEPGAYRLIIGRTLAEELGLEVGDTVIALVSEGSATPAGIVPRMRRFTVAGIFYAGMYEYDRGLVFMHRQDAARLFRLGEAVTGIRLAFREPLDAPGAVRAIASAFGGGVYVTDWTRQHANFFRSIQLTKSIIFVVLLLVVAVAAFNIVSTLVMVVRDKRSEIAILRTLGAPPGAIMSVFMAQGLVVGAVGTLLGTLLGLLVAANIGALVLWLEGLLGIRFLAPDVYFISELPSRIAVGDVGRVTAIALLLGLASTVYPAWRGAATVPAEVLRYE